MNYIARRIYAILRQRVNAAHATPGTQLAITYGELVAELRKNASVIKMYPNLKAKDADLDYALGEIVDACRQRGIPAIAAIVVRRDLRVPGDKYYGRAHRHANGDRPTEMLGWVYEFWTVSSYAYPVRL